MKDFMVVLLGSDDNVYGFARSLHKRYGIRPIAVATRVLEPTKNSKIIDIIIDERIHDDAYFGDILNDLSQKLKKEYKKLILIPCSDSYMELCVKNRDKLKNYENEYITLDKLKEFNDKESFYKMCDKYNLAYPKTYICNPKNYTSVISKLDLDYPLILKPNNSNSLEYLDAKFEGKEKVYFIYNKEELVSKIKAIYSSTYKDDLIIQKYVSGDDTNMRVLNVYCDKNSKVKMMSLGQPILEEYHPNTYGNYATIISLTEHIDLMDKIKDFLESIGYKGAANFDIKKDEITGKYYIFEINPRPGRSSFFTACAGIGFAACYVEDLVYNDLHAELNNQKEILWMNIPYVLVKKYVKNKDILKKVHKLRKTHEYYHTLIYKEDYNLDRRKTVLKNYLRKIKYFPKYYIEKK